MWTIRLRPLLAPLLILTLCIVTTGCGGPDEETGKTAGESEGAKAVEAEKTGEGEEMARQKEEGEEEEIVLSGDETATIETDFGTIVLQFYPDVAPGHVKNFITLAKKGFYDGLTFHRIIPGFVIQGGCPRGDGTGSAGYTIPAEFSDRKHLTGTLAMARGMDPNSASCQFYICLAPQPSLDGKYTVFGQVVEGLDVVQAMGRVETGARDRPLEPVIMEKVTISSPSAASESEK